MSQVPGHTSGLIATAVLARRDLIRFRRQPVRIVAAVGTPLLLWVFMIGGFARAIDTGALGDVDYGVYVLPGTMTLVAIFASIFGSISIIEDRHAGWLRTVLASPAPRWSIAAGKTLGGACVAFIQAAMLLPSVFFLETSPGLVEFIQLLAALMLTCIAMTAVGLAFAWRCETTGGFHAVMNLVLMPMWLLSGAFFPIDAASGWLGALATLNPLTWCTHAIRAPFQGVDPTVPLLIAAVFAAVSVGMATWVIARPTRRLA